MSLTATGFVNEIYYKKQATSNIRTKLFSKNLFFTKINMRDSEYKTQDGSVKLHPTIGKKWVLLIKNYFDSYGFHQ